MIKSKILNVILLFYSFLHIITAQSVTVPSNIEARVIVLYQQANTSIPNQTYPFTFNNNNLSIFPQFGFGINDYKMGNSLGHQNFVSQATNLSYTAVGIRVTTDNSTIILKFSISYIAIWNLDSIFIISESYTNPANISSSSGSRFYQIYKVYSFTDSNAIGLPFLKGFYETNLIAAQINITITVISVANYVVYMDTVSNCIIKYISFDILFYYPDLISNSSYVYRSETSGFSSSTNNVNSYTQTISNYSNTVFILGLSGFYAFTFANDTFGWSVANVTNNTATVVINKTSIQIIHYSYFQIGALAHSTPSSTNNTNSSNSSNAQSDANTAAPEKSNYIGIIAGIIAGVAVVAVAVVIVIKCYFKNTIYHIPEKDDFRILPTLSV